MRGRVLPIGGLKEKPLCVPKNAGIENVLIPVDNVKDLEEIEQEIKTGLNITPVTNMEEVLQSTRSRKGAKMIIKMWHWRQCVALSTLPKNTLPEIAFAGKSNVGKSSLINGLMNRKSLARTSAQPGKTQTINYYNINQELYFCGSAGLWLCECFCGGKS